VFENRVLRRILGPKRDELIGKWRIMRGLTILLIKYCSRYQIEKNWIGGACITYAGEDRCIQGVGGET
jgi:hypothetical protein